MTDARQPQAIAVIGAGPAGSLFAALLARAGRQVTIFDHSHPREKPCGGGLTLRSLDLLERLGIPRSALPLHIVDQMYLHAARGPALRIALPAPIATVSRREFDGALLAHARAQGAHHDPRRVFRIETSGRVATASGNPECFDLIVGADGANSVVRRSLSTPIPVAQLTLGMGYMIPGRCDLHLRFVPDLKGYIWLFPRHDHVAAGISAPLTMRQPGSALCARLRDEIAVRAPHLDFRGLRTYAHLIPAYSASDDALRSLLAEVILAEQPTCGYVARLLADFGRDYQKAAQICERFYSPDFTDRMLAMSRKSRAIRTVLADLLIGRQGYGDLKARLIRAAPLYAFEHFVNWLTPSKR
ncbi:MAG: FAD-dependent monooxygenase [Vicinamibacteria bacterium]|nr:FAD-dependent monooxygenase [Vicinamibacteria bacterium]